MPKISYINTENGICLLVDGKYIPVKQIAEQIGIEIEDDDDIFILIDAISSVAIEGGKL